jgi:hypothetical protein
MGQLAWRGSMRWLGDQPDTLADCGQIDVFIEQNLHGYEREILLQTVGVIIAWAMCLSLHTIAHRGLFQQPLSQCRFHPLSLLLHHHV